MSLFRSPSFPTSPASPTVSSVSPPAPAGDDETRATGLARGGQSPSAPQTTAPSAGGDRWIERLLAELDPS